MKTKNLLLISFLAMLLLGMTNKTAAQSTPFCGVPISTMPGGNNTLSSQDALISVETLGNGDITVTLDPVNNNNPVFRTTESQFVAGISVNGVSNSSNSLLTVVGNPIQTNVLTLHPVNPIAADTPLAFAGILEYATAGTGNGDLWPTPIFTYYYGTTCADVAKVTVAPETVNFTPTQGTQTFTLTGVNIAGDLTLTAPKGLSVSPQTITPAGDGTVNQTVTVTWEDGATSSGSITISGGGLLINKKVAVTSSGFSEYCNSIISQGNDGATNMAYLTVTTSADKTQVIFAIAPYDTDPAATAAFTANKVGTVTAASAGTATVTYSTDNTVATATFATPLTTGDVVSFANPLVWALTGTMWTNGNCYINGSKTYTVGLGCSLAGPDAESPVVVSAGLVSSTAYNAVISVNATDNVGVTQIHVVDATNKIDTTMAAKNDNGSANYTINNLQGSTAYSLFVTALDLVGNETAAADAQTVTFTTPPAPVITATPTTLNFAPPTATQTFDLSGANLTAPVQLSVPPGYTVSPSTFAPDADGTIAATTVTVTWISGLGNTIIASGGGLLKPQSLISLTHTGILSSFCNYVLTQGGGTALTTPALLNIAISSDSTMLTYTIAPYDITGDATWNGNSLGANIFLVNGNAVTVTRTAVDSHTIAITFDQPLTKGDVVTYAAGTTLVWTTTGYTNYGNNGNCYIDSWNAPYTVGLAGCDCTVDTPSSLLIDDFEQGKSSWVASGNSSWMSVLANPSPTDINTSSNVLVTQMATDCTWDGAITVGYTPYQTFPIPAGWFQYLHVMEYRAVASGWTTPVNTGATTIKINDGNGGVSLTQMPGSVPQDSMWVDMVYQLPSNVDINYLYIMPDYANKQNVNAFVYYDNIVLNNDPNPIPSTPVTVPVTLQVVDQSKGIITNASDHNTTNIFCWVDDNLAAQNPLVNGSWWYPMYDTSIADGSDVNITPNGSLTQGTGDWTWGITLNAQPGTYEWNPYAKSLGWNPINPDMYAYTGDDSNNNNFIFTVSNAGSVFGSTQLVIPFVTYPVTLKVIDQTKGEITNASDHNLTNIYCWIDDNLKAQNPNSPSNWWYPMYDTSVADGTDVNITPNGALTQGTDDWTWEITLNVMAGTYEWNPQAKSLGWTTLNQGMYNYTADDGNNLKFTVASDGTISGNYEITIPNDNVGISNAGLSNVVVVGGKSSISATFNGVANVSVYSVQGVLIKTASAQSDFEIGNLTAGIYLVKVNNSVYKAIVK